MLYKGHFGQLFLMDKLGVASGRFRNSKSSKVVVQLERPFGAYDMLFLSSPQPLRGPHKAL